MITYEWDEQKRQVNLDGHKLDFLDAWQVYEAENKITLESPYPHEKRLIDLAEVEGRVLLLVYTLRNEPIRCISFRFAKRKERRIYHEQSTNR